MTTRFGKQRKTITLRMPSVWHCAIQSAAAAVGWSMNRYLLEIVNADLNLAESVPDCDDDEAGVPDYSDFHMTVEVTLWDAEGERAATIPVALPELQRYMQARVAQEAADRARILAFRGPGGLDRE